MNQLDNRSDRALLVATKSDPQAFAVFYRRHLGQIVSFFMGKTNDAELTADLTAEVFAAALRAAGRRAPKGDDCTPWLYSIAQKIFASSLRRKYVENKARKKLGISPQAISVDDLCLTDRIAEQTSPSLELIKELPHRQRFAIRARVLEEYSYSDIAERMDCSESVVRQNVSRGLKQLRVRMQEDT